MTAPSLPISNAILVYLATKLGRTDWLPRMPRGPPPCSAGCRSPPASSPFGPAAARLITVFGAKFNPDDVIARAHVLLKRLEAHLADRDWLVGAGPTIADVALYSYLSSAPEGNVDLSAYPRVDAFLRRIEALPGFVPFARTAAGLEGGGVTC